HEVPEIAGVVALGIVEAVFLAFGIEMSARGFEIGTFTFRQLMEMDGMFPGRQVVKMEIDGDTGALVPENDVAHWVAPAVFYVDPGLGPKQRGRDQNEQQPACPRETPHDAPPPASPNSPVSPDYR